MVTTLAICLAILFLISTAFLVYLARKNSKQIQDLKKQKDNLDKEKIKLEVELSALKDIKNERDKKEEELKQKIGECEGIKKQLEALKEAQEKYEKNTKEQLEKWQKEIKETQANTQRMFSKNLEETQKTMKESFENLSNNTLETQIKKFDENQNRQTQQLFKDCKDALDEVNKKTKAEISTSIDQLVKSQREASAVAAKLATAFSTDTKRQGDWGEMVLENILTEVFGLHEGIDFEKQVVTNDGQRPDFKLRLGSDKCIAIDSKVSINKYKEYANLPNDDEHKKERENAMNGYLSDIRTHILTLGKKRYDKTICFGSERTVDFTLMFFAVESAYIEAIKQDVNILKLASDNHVAIVTASSLSSVIQMLKRLWNDDALLNNFDMAVEKMNNIYKKLGKFVEHLNKVNSSIEMALNENKKAVGLIDENGRQDNIVNTAKQIQELLPQIRKTAISKSGKETTVIPELFVSQEQVSEEENE